MKCYKRLNVFVTVTVFAVTILLGVLVFSMSYYRLYESIIDLSGSFRYYFVNLFGGYIADYPSVTAPSEVMKNMTALPAEFDDFIARTRAFFTMFVRGDNFATWGKYIGEKCSTVAKIISVLLPCLLVVWIVIKRLYERPNNDYAKDTVPLKAFKAITRHTYLPIKRFICQYVGFVRRNGWIWKIWLIIWACHFNVVSIVIEFFAYYFFFAISFRLDTLYMQFVKLIVDLQVLFTKTPLWVLIIAGGVVFDNWRKKTALRRLRHFEARNCGFIKELPIVSMAVGSMGKKKTTLITDMSLSQEVMMRQEALIRLRNIDMKFPCFPWIILEKEIENAILCGKIYNLATVKKWINDRERAFVSDPRNSENAFGYDVNRYPIEYDNGLHPESLYSVLSTYSRLYFIYIVESSLILSNYSIRVSNEKTSCGNFPLWDTDFFGNDKDGRHSHILDFDMLRLGRKVAENNPNADSFEFGVVAITEIGKERGNNLELKEVKKNTEETNQKNDLFNSWLKMCRHSATVDNFSFIKVFADEQRPESWGSDARDLCDIIHIISSSESSLVLPFYTIEEMIIEWVNVRFIDLYAHFRYIRGDNTLFVYVLKNVSAWLYNRNERIKNRYAYCVLKLEKERGTRDGKRERKKYFLMNRKIYNKRFSTDCFSDYFDEKAKHAKVGLEQYAEYETEKATVKELKTQNSYFINSLYGKE